MRLSGSESEQMSLDRTSVGSQHCIKSTRLQIWVEILPADTCALVDGNETRRDGLRYLYMSVIIGEREAWRRLGLPRSKEYCQSVL